MNSIFKPPVTVIFGNLAMVSDGPNIYCRERHTNNTQPKISGSSWQFYLLKCKKHWQFGLVSFFSHPPGSGNRVLER